MAREAKKSSPIFGFPHLSPQYCIQHWLDKDRLIDSIFLRVQKFCQGPVKILWKKNAPRTSHNQAKGCKRNYIIAPKNEFWLPRTQTFTSSAICTSMQCLLASFLNHLSSSFLCARNKDQIPMHLMRENCSEILVLKACPWVDPSAPSKTAKFWEDDLADPELPAPHRPKTVRQSWDAKSETASVVFFTLRIAAARCPTLARWLFKACISFSRWFKSATCFSLSTGS